MKFEYELINKEKVSKASDEVIDVLRKKYGLTPLECAYALECLLGGLEDTMGCTFSPVPNKEYRVGDKK